MPEKPQKIKVELLENFLVVWDSAEGSQLYKNGYYGKPLGIAKPKIPEFNVPLILDLMEGVYLAEKGKSALYEGAKQTQCWLGEAEAESQELYEEFDEKYVGLSGPAGQRLNCDAWDKVRLRLRSLQVRSRCGTCALHGIGQELRVQIFLLRKS